MQREQKFWLNLNVTDIALLHILRIPFIIRSNDQQMSRYHTIIRNGCNTQICLLLMTENFAKSTKQGGEYTVLLTNLSNTLAVYLLSYE